MWLRSANAVTTFGAWAKIATVADIEALDVSNITGFGNTKTLATLTETDGKIAATFQDIAFPVTSVAGKTGAVTLAKGDVGLGNVDNTADANKSVNYATSAGLLAGTARNNTTGMTTDPGTGKINYSYDVYYNTTGMFNATNNANSIMTIKRHSGNYFSQIGFSSDGRMYYRDFENATLNTTTAWSKIAFTSDIPTNLNQLTNGPGYVTSSGVTSITLKAGAGITLDTDNTAITSTGTRTISISGMNTSSGSTTKWLNEKGGWSTPTAANVGALASNTTITNVSFTGATDDAEYPILMKNSTGSTTTAAGVKFANTSGKGVTINPSSGTISATGLNINGQIQGSLGSNFKTITINGDANTYYPVIIQNPNDYYPATLVNITRIYHETAPDTWNTSTHRGGLTCTFLWNGSRYWDGNGAGGGDSIELIRLQESYCNMVGKIGNSTAGLVVWLRGGGANYHIFSQKGTILSVTVNLSTYTDSASQSFAPITAVDSNNIASYRRLNVNAVTATKLKDNASNTTGSFWRGDNTWSNTLLGPLKIGAPDTAANTGYATANVGSQNYIAFYGVYNDGGGSYNHTYIGESIYGPKTTTNEQSELLLFKGNDMSASGPDRIRLFAAEVDIQTYTSALSGTWDTIRATTGTQIANFKKEQVTITGNILPEANNTRNLGSSSVKWANVYATTFTGNLTGNVTGNATTATTATYSTYPKIVAGNEVRFDVSTKPSNAIDLYIGYAWSDGSKDAKINGYRFLNGNGSNFAKVYASEFVGALNGNAATASKIAAKLASTTKTFLLGTSTTITGTAANVELIGDTGVYLTTTVGQLSAKSYSINDGTNEKVRMEWNATDQSLDFIFA